VLFIFEGRFGIFWPAEGAVDVVLLCNIVDFYVSNELSNKVNSSTSQE